MENKKVSRLILPLTLMLISTPVVSTLFGAVLNALAGIAMQVLSPEATLLGQGMFFGMALSGVAGVVLLVKRT